MKNYSIFLFNLLFRYYIFPFPSLEAIPNLIASFSAPNDRCDNWRLQFQSLQSYRARHLRHSPRQTLQVGQLSAGPRDRQFGPDRWGNTWYESKSVLTIVYFSLKSEVWWRGSTDQPQSGDVPHRRPQYSDGVRRIHSTDPELGPLGRNILESSEVMNCWSCCMAGSTDWSSCTYSCLNIAINK